MTRFLRIAIILTLIPACDGVSNASGAPMVDTGQFADEISGLLTLMREQGALLDGQADLSGRLRQAVCRAIDPSAEILDAAAADLRAEEDAGIFYGIGAQLEIRDQRPRVLKVSPDSPASDAGLPVGALIEKIDDADTLAMPLAEAAARLRGRRDQPLTLQFRVPSAPPSVRNDASLTNTPDIAELQTLQFTRSLRQMPMTGMVEDWPLQLAYMKINGIYSGSGDYIAGQLREWAARETSGIILDLRGAGGADLESVAAIGSLFAPANQTLFGIRAARDCAISQFVASEQPTLKIPVMALIDTDTHAASAILAGVLRNCRGAMLIGAPSRFDMVLRSFVPLPDGKMLYTATQRVEFPDMPDDDVKLVPDVQIAPDARAPAPPAPENNNNDIFAKISDQERLESALAERIGTDAPLRRAADILLGLNALNIKAR